MKRVLTLREKSILINGASGITYIIFGCIQIFQSNLMVNTILTILIALSTLLELSAFLFKTESEDEMSQYNRYRTKTKAYELLSLGFSICILIALLKESWMIDIKIVLPFLLGAVNLFELILFLKYEKVGA